MQCKDCGAKVIKVGEEKGYNIYECVNCKEQEVKRKLLHSWIMIFGVIIFLGVGGAIATTVITSSNINTNSIDVDNNISADYFVGSGLYLTDLPTSGNTTWNQSGANSLYSGIQWGYNHTAAANGTIYSASGQWWYNQTGVYYYNQTTATNEIYGIWWYNHTSATYNLYGTNWYNHTLAIDGLYGKWFYNQTYGGSTYNATYDSWSYNQTEAGSAYSYNQTLAVNDLYGLWFYNQTAATYNLYGTNWYNHTLSVNGLYGKWFYNMTYSGSTYNSTYYKWSYNQTYSGSIYNESYNSLIQWGYNMTLATNDLYGKWWYNMTYSGSTYNATYNSLLQWGYNETLAVNSLYGLWFYNQTYSGSTYNSTYAGLIQNGSYLSTYNSTYNGLIQNGSYLSTYNSTYNGLIQNGSYLSTYNSTYSSWGYNQTAAGNKEFYNRTSNIDTAGYNITTNTLNVSKIYSSLIAVVGAPVYIGSETVKWLKGWFVNLDVSGNSTMNNTYARVMNVTENIVQGDVKLNQTGIYHSNSKAYARTADVVVCRGTSTLDDLVKMFTCDVVCLSTDNDCQQELQSTLGSNCDNKRILWLPGRYPVITRDQISNTAFLYAGCSNFTLDAYGVVLNINYTNSGTIQRGFEVGNGLRENVNINGLEIMGNRNNGSSSTYGLRLWSCKHCTIRDTKVSNVNGFQYTVESINSSSYSENVHFDNVYGRGIGVADIIGGGGYTKNIYITNSRLEQNLENGTYGNAIDLVNLTGFYVSGNNVNGGLLVGTEEGSSNSVSFVGNIVYPPYNKDGTWNLTSNAFFGFSLATISHSVISNNIVYDTLDGSGNLITNNIFGNIFPNSSIKQTENYINNIQFGSSALYINSSSNNVGIGTSVPNTGFVVNREVAFIGVGGQVTNQNGLMFWGSTNGGTIYARGDASGNDDDLVLKASHDVKFITGNSNNYNFTISTSPVTISNLSGSGNDYACLDPAGKLFRSDSAC